MKPHWRQSRVASQAIVSQIQASNTPGWFIAKEQVLYCIVGRVRVACAHCPVAVEERNLILTPPCWCWCCSRDSFYIWQECYLRLSTAAEKIHLWYLIWSPPCPQASWLYQQDCCTAAVALAMPRISAFYTLAFASPSLMCFFAPNPLPDYQRQSEVGHAWSKLIQFWNGDDVGCGLVAGEWAMWNVKEERTRRQAVNIPS